MCEPRLEKPQVTDRDGVIVERKHAVLSITLNRQTAASSLSADMVEQIIAAIVQTAGRPGLRDRIAAYRELVMDQKRSASGGQ